MLLQNSISGAGSKAAFIPPIQQASQQPTSGGVIHNVFAGTEDRLAVLTKVIAELEQRLCHILTPIGPAPSGSDGSGRVPLPSGSPLVERLSNINAVLDMITNHAAHLIGRLEI